MTEPNTCVCCLGTESTPFIAGHVQCASCSHVWADVTLSDEELRELYGHGYYQDGEFPGYELERPALRRNFKRRLARIQERHPEGGRLWEIGCAYGFFLEQARQAFDVAGCDISEHAVQYARESFGLDVRHEDYLAFEPPASFDVVCMWDTIEHLRDPHLYVEKAARDLRFGGTIAIGTGDIGAWVPRHRGAKWRLIHPPTHLHHFSVRSVRRLLERCGFEVVSVDHLAFWRHADGMARRVFAEPPDKWTAPLYRMVHALGLLNFAFPLQTFDLMMVLAEKTSPAS